MQSHGGINWENEFLGLVWTVFGKRGDNVYFVSDFYSRKEAQDCVDATEDPGSYTIVGPE